MSRLMANVLPAPVSPVISQPRQKSFRSHTNPAREAVVCAFLDLSGAQHQPRGMLTSTGRKLSHPTTGSKNQPSARQTLQSKRSGRERIYENLMLCLCGPSQSTASVTARVKVALPATYL